MPKFEQLPPATGLEWTEATELGRPLRRALSRIAPSLAEGRCPQYPTRLTFENGVTLNNVMLVDAFVAYAVGSWRGNLSLFANRGIDDLIAIEEAADRLPAAAANEIYATAVERNMGAYEFVLRFLDRPPLVAKVGNLVDFVSLPSGYSFDHFDSIDLERNPSWDSLQVVRSPPIEIAAFR